MAINALVKGIDPFGSGIRNFLGDIMNASYEGVYWFFFPLFAIYLCIPILSTMIERRDVLWYMVGAGFVFNSLLPALFRETGITWNTNLTIPMMGGYILYPVLGYLLATAEIKKNTRIFIYFCGFFGIMLRYVMTYILSTTDGEINKTFFGYTDYYSVFLAVAVFVFVRYSAILKWIAVKEAVVKRLSILSSLSFGIYLLHMIVYRFLETYVNANTYGWRLIMPFGIYGICALIVFTVKKIPVLKKIVP